MTESSSTERIAIGYVVRAKGVQGEVKVEPLTHSATRFDELTNVVLEHPDHEGLELQIESWRYDQPGVLIKFVGFDEPESANATLVKGYLTIRREMVPPPPEDEHYVFDLIGCAIVDESGRQIGEIVNILEMPASDVYVVRRGESEIMIPAGREFVREISIPNKRVCVSGIDAFLD